jgi:putative transposase
VKVHEAGLSDLEGAKLLLSGIQEDYPRMRLIWVDWAYRGLREWLKSTLGWELEVVKHWWRGGAWLRENQEIPPRPEGFHVLPRRWVVERTFGWLGRNRRLSKDYEYLLESEEDFVYLGMVRLMLSRLVFST